MVLTKNRVGKYGKWIDPNNSKMVYSIGNYIPLHIGMNVEVLFDTMNHDSGADVKIRTEVPAGVLESPEKEEQDT